MESQLGSDSEGPDSAVQTGGNGGAALSSRISIQKVCAVLGQFNEFKMRLVDEMGFGGMKQIHMLPKINLRFSSWLMQRVDVEAMILEITQSFLIQLTDQSVHSVFSLPIGPNLVCQETDRPTEIMARYTEEASTHGQKGVHSLKAAEVILLKHLNEDSSPTEVGCFQIAFAIYVVGHLLAPTSKHDYVSLDFIGSLNDPSLIGSFNWCRYVIKHIALAARKLQSDVSRNVSALNIGGCHLYLQVYYIDQLDLGVLNKTRDLVPRIAFYDYESLRKMIDCIVAANADDSVFLPPGMNNQESMDHGQGQTQTPILHTPVSKEEVSCGPRQFSSFLKAKYPQHAESKIAMLLKEHQARLLFFTNDFKRNCQEEISSFTEKILNATPAHCKCTNLSAKESCSAALAGPAKCVKDTMPPRMNAASTPSRMEVSQDERSTGHSPLKSAIQTTRTGSARSRGSESSSGFNSIDPIDCEESRRTRMKKIPQPDFESAHTDMLAAATGHAAGSPFDIQTLFVDTLDHKAPVEATVTQWSYDTVTGLVYAYIDHDGDAAAVTFGKETEVTPTCLAVRPSRLCRDPWSVGAIVSGPSPTAAYAIVDWIARAPSSAMARNWVSHPFPRVLEIDGIYIRQQIIGSQPLSHEMCVLLVRRLGQIVNFACKDASGTRWRKFIEPDFSVYALANLDPMKLVSTHNTFTSDSSNFLVTSCRMYYLMAQMEDGWVAYGFDMQQKIIHVLDPVAGSQGFSNSRVDLHTFCSTRLITALFRSIKAFYDNWSCGTDGWQRRFPILMTEDFRREDSGLCAIYLARYYNGDKLVKPLTKENLHMHRRVSLYEVMRLEGNRSKMLADVLEAIKTSFHVL